MFGRLEIFNHFQYKMRHFKHIPIILFMLTSCSTEMDSDLETAINNGYVSDTYNDLPGTLYTEIAAQPLLITQPQMPNFFTILMTAVSAISP